MDNILVLHYEWSSFEGKINISDLVKSLKWLNTISKIIDPDSTLELGSWQEICQEPSFCKIWKWFYLPNNAYLLTEYSDYLLWVLNSKLVFWYFKTISQSLWEEWLRYTKQYVERIPIPKKNDKNNEITGQIEEKVIKINSIKEAILQSDTSELEKEIDDLVYQLYELTPEEIELIEKGV